VQRKKKKKYWEYSTICWGIGNHIKEKWEKAAAQNAKKKN